MSNNAHALVNKYVRGEVDEREGSTLTKGIIILQQLDRRMPELFPLKKVLERETKWNAKGFRFEHLPGTLDDNDTSLPEERKANIKKMFQIYGQKAENKNEHFKIFAIFAILGVRDVSVRALGRRGGCWWVRDVLSEVHRYFEVMSIGVVYHHILMIFFSETPESPNFCQFHPFVSELYSTRGRATRKKGHHD